MERLSALSKQISSPLEVCIVAAGRTPIDKANGKLQSFTASNLAAVCLSGTLSKHSIASSCIDQLYVGCVSHTNLGQNFVKQVANKAELPPTASTFAINKACASAMKAVMLGALAISTGDAEVVAAGGVEVMSKIPYVVPKARFGLQRGNHKVLDGMVHDGLWDPIEKIMMFEGSDYVANKMCLTREELDSYANSSYRKAQAAWNEGKYDKEIVKVKLPNKTWFERDNIRTGPANSAQLHLGKGPSTPGNTCSINDGSSFVVLCSRKKAQEMGWPVLGSILGIADAELNGKEFPLAPAQATMKLLRQCNLEVNEIDFMEVNEPFSTVPVSTAKVLRYDINRINKYGGVIALGHPVGSSGCRILVTMLSVLSQENGNLGVASICNAGGGASALLVRRG